MLASRAIGLIASSPSIRYHLVLQFLEDQMIASFLGYFSISNFMPHGHCYLWKPEILWLHVISDTLIALSYFSIPIMIYYFIKKKDNIPHPRVFKLFATFIFWCGLTHLIAIWTVWQPVYQIEGLAKGVTALVSLGTALILFPIIPKLLALRSPKDLDALNKKLQSALEEKQKAEVQLRSNNEKLEIEVRNRTEELSKYVRKLNAANNELESFAYQASHDLKSPLSTLISYVEEIEADKNNLPKIHDYLPRIKRQLHQLNGLITDLLELSRVDAQDIEREWVSFADVLTEAKSNLNHIIEEKKAKIYSDHSFELYANRNQLTSVFQNLLENALKYTVEGVTPEIMISATEDDRFWKFEVKDNGIGLDEKNFEKIFKPFQRLHTSDEYPGTGLGLSICHKIVERHRGQFYVKSDPKVGGSSFIFTIYKSHRDEA